MKIKFFSSTIMVISMFVTLISYAHDSKKCHKKDDQAALAHSCENNFSTTGGRVECLADSRLVATIEFCSRQYSSDQGRVDCIKKVDKSE